MPDIFLSYSRRNGEFVRRLHKLLADAGKDIWIDFEDIPLSSSWWEEIREGIESSDTFVFVLSPDSVASPICNFEIAHALAHHKRIVPIVRQPLDVEDGYTLVLSERLNDSEVQILGTRNLEQVAREAWGCVAQHNWLFFTDDEQIEENLKKLLSVTETDLEHARTHTRLLLRARQWENSNKLHGLLLTDDETVEAENWLSLIGEKIPQATPLHIEYIYASRLRHRRRQHQMLIAVSVALVFTVILAIAAIGFFIQANIKGNQAATSAAEAIANAATATFAQGDAENQANRAATNARQAMDSAATATFAQGEAENQANLAATNAEAAELERNKAEDSSTQAALSAANASTQAAIANANRQAALNAQENVVIERNRARSIALAALAETELDLQTTNPDPERAIILAIAALERFDITWQAERALGLAVVDTLTPLTFFEHERLITDVEMSHDGRWMVTADEAGVVLIWDAQNFSVVQRLTEHTAGITAVYYAPDETRLLTTSGDTTARIWDLETGLAVQHLQGHTQSVLGGDWSPDNTKVLTFGLDGEAIIWDATTGVVLVRMAHGVPVRAADWSPDGSIIVTGADDGLARVWSADGMLLHTFDGHLPTVQQPRAIAITALAFSPDGNLIATGGTDRNIYIWDARNAQTITILEGHVMDIAQIYWSQNSLWLASIDGLNTNNFTRNDATARIWNVKDANSNFVLFDHTGLVNNAAWFLSPISARLATVGEDGMLFITDAVSGGQMLGLTESAPITVVAWSADGGALITGNAQGQIQVWYIWSSAAELVAYARSCCNIRALTDEEARQFNLPIPTSIPASSVEIVQCNNGAAAQRLYPGTRARVLTTGSPESLNVRTRPSTLARVEAQIPLDQTFRVIAGPFCDERNPIAWYEIQYGLSAATGYVAELQGDEYFVEPLP
jgi:WD40 repeat protein